MIDWRHVEDLKGEKFARDELILVWTGRPAVMSASTILSFKDRLRQAGYTFWARINDPGRD